MTGLRILRAIIDGERDPHRLAEFCDGRIKASVETIAVMLQCTGREEHLFALTQAMQRFDFFTKQFETSETQIDSLTPLDGGSDGDLSPPNLRTLRVSGAARRRPPEQACQAD